MNQIFRINIGPETLQGRLPPVRVGHRFSSVFHVTGAGDASAIPPRIWITVDDPNHEGEGQPSKVTLFWIGQWNHERGLWQIHVNPDATRKVGIQFYALTIAGGTNAAEYIAGQGTFTVYQNIVVDGESGGTAGDSLDARLLALTERVESLETRFAALSTLPMIDPDTAKDWEMREQVRTITNMLRGGE